MIPYFLAAHPTELLIRIRFSPWLLLMRILNGFLPAQNGISAQNAEKILDPFFEIQVSLPTALRQIPINFFFSRTAQFYRCWIRTYDLKTLGTIAYL